MALIDYKIVQLSHTGRHVSVTVRLYNGSMQNVSHPITGNITNQYVRTAMIAERNYEYDVQRDMTQEVFLNKARALLNRKLFTFAQMNSHNVIIQQQDTVDLEAVDNETST